MKLIVIKIILANVREELKKELKIIMVETKTNIFYVIQ